MTVDLKYRQIRVVSTNKNVRCEAVVRKASVGSNYLDCDKVRTDAKTGVSCNFNSCINVVSNSNNRNRGSSGLKVN